MSALVDKLILLVGKNRLLARYVGSDRYWAAYWRTEKRRYPELFK